ncbi:hypothetical protein CM19_12090 [Candidatus Acidianus copahuensis]|uniref:Uncharacterized protein n=1 Tax=Candidatus Acidianus copahuensis TaxID=1160895 RepID=A0A031LI32_9CREN|nr:hypothetical protein CM19_12090 [Candidatus Acidianus copahuensis]
MNFLEGKERAVLTTIAQGGPAGIRATDLYPTLSLFMSQQTVQKTIEDLYFSGYITILRDGDEVRYIASKQVRNALVNLEMQKYKLGKYIENLKMRIEEIQKLEKTIQVNEMKKVATEGTQVVAFSVLSLLKEVPELTIPEAIEIISKINDEVLSKLFSLISPEMTEEDIKHFLLLVSKYNGEKDAELLRITMEAIKTRNEKKNTTNS